MKKMTVLFTILCAGQLYGMEAQNIRDLPKELRQEITKMALASSTTIDEAIKAIQDSSMIYGGVQLDNIAAMNLLIPNDFDKAINQVRNLQGTELKDFTRLVGVLAQKFPDLTREEIAQNFNTPVAKEYSKLNYKLAHTLHVQPGYMLNLVKESLAEGADPNYTWKGKNPDETWLRISYGKKDTDYHSILGEAYNKRALAQEPIEKKARTEVIELLLAKGANPNVR